VKVGLQKHGNMTGNLQGFSGMLERFEIAYTVEVGLDTAMNVSFRFITNFSLSNTSA
jgi:hypothetical protein